MNRGFFENFTIYQDNYFHFKLLVRVFKGVSGYDFAIMYRPVSTYRKIFIEYFNLRYHVYLFHLLWEGNVENKK